MWIRKPGVTVRHAIRETFITDQVYIRLGNAIRCLFIKLALAARFAVDLRVLNWISKIYLRCSEPLLGGGRHFTEGLLTEHVPNLFCV